MSHRIVAVFATVTSAGLLSVTLWPSTLAEMTVMLLTLGNLLNVALTNNSLTKTLIDSPIQNRRLRVEEGTDYHGWSVESVLITLLPLISALSRPIRYSNTAVSVPKPQSGLSRPITLSPIV